MNNAWVSSLSIVIVDPAPDDYQRLVEGRLAKSFDVRFVRTGEEALRTVPPSRAAWLINSRLPDMTGPELIQLLRPALRRAPVFLVADQYDPAAEIAALSTGSVQFLTKPLSADFATSLESAFAVRTAPRISRTAALAAEACQMAVAGA